MTQPNDTQTESDDGKLLTTRRKVIGALASAGVLGATASAATGDTDAAIGGGPMADEIADLQVKVYKGTFAERPEAGVEGRVYEVYDPGAQNHGAVYYDTGDAWELEDLQVQDLHSESGTFGEVSTDETAIGRAWNPLRAETHHHRNHGTIPITGLFVGNNSPNATQNDATYNADTGEVTNGPGDTIAEYMDIRYRLQPVSNGFVELQDDQFSQRNVPTWEKARAVRFGAFANNWNERKYFVTGRAQFTDGSSSKRWIGFKVDGGTLYAVMNDPDGGNYQETAIRTFSDPTSQSHVDLLVEYEPAVSEARFYVGNFEVSALGGATTDTLTLEETFTTGFPSGALNSQAAVMWHHMNKTYSSTTPETHINDVEVVMMPDGSF